MYDETQEENPTLGKIARIAVIGKAKSGKTTLATKLSKSKTVTESGTFNVRDYRGTITHELKARNINIGDEFDAAFVCLDLKQGIEQLMEDARSQIDEFTKHFPSVPRGKIIFVGTKDDEYEHDETVHALRLLAEELGICLQVHRTSANHLERDDIARKELLGRATPEQNQEFDDDDINAPAELSAQEKYNSAKKTIDERAYSPGKKAILHQVNYQIYKMESAKGWTINKDLEKEALVTELYDELVDEGVDENLHQIITNWNELEKNKDIIKRQRREFFQPKETSTEKMINAILKEANKFIVNPNDEPKPVIVTNMNYKADLAALHTAEEGKQLDPDQVIDPIDFTPKKIEILKLVTDQIDKIQSSKGYILKKDPTKANALIDLYTKLYVCKDPVDLKAVIEAWEETEAGQEATSADNFRGMFKPAKTGTVIMVDKILDIANTLQPEIGGGFKHKLGGDDDDAGGGV